jgi:hypothetical protein
LDYPAFLGGPLLRIGSAHVLVVINKRPGHDTGFRAEHIRGKSGYLVWGNAHTNWTYPVVLCWETDIELPRFDLDRISPQINTDRRPFRFAGWNVEPPLMSWTLNDFS